MIYRRDRVVWGAVLFRTINPEVIEGAIVRRSERLHWSSEEAKEGRVAVWASVGTRLKDWKLTAYPSLAARSA